MGQSKEGLDVTITIRLRGRRLQIFSKNRDLKLSRQLHLNADHFLCPLAASGCTICSLSFVALVSFCHEMEHREHISCMFVIWYSEDLPKETQLVLSYSVDEGLGVRHLMDSCIAYTIKTLNIQHDPITGCSECICLVFHVDRQYPGFTSI